MSLVRESAAFSEHRVLERKGKRRRTPPRTPPRMGTMDKKSPEVPVRLSHVATKGAKQGATGDREQKRAEARQGRSGTREQKRDALIPKSHRWRRGNQERWRSEGSIVGRGASARPCTGEPGGPSSLTAASERRRRGLKGGKPWRTLAVERRVTGGDGAHRGRSQAENSSRGVSERTPKPEGLKREWIRMGAKGVGTGSRASSVRRGLGWSTFHGGR
eukprot:scaffold7100_cov95-Cylindrotheca_fusiformis.AAC.2